MEANKENTGQQNSAAMAGMPDWLKHLLTGLGTLGIDFLLFIKPLQEKFEAQGKQINDQEKRITELEDNVDILIKRIKSKEQNKEIVNENNNDELFNLSRRSTGGNRFQKPNYTKL